MFRAISSDAFAPFGELRLELPEVEDKPDGIAEVHLFTGVNGTGKTRLLSILSAMLGSGAHLQKRMKGVGSAYIAATDNFHDFGQRGQWPRVIAAENQVLWQVRHQLVQWAVQVPAFAYSSFPYLTDSPVSAMGQVVRPNRDQCLAFNRPENSSQILLQAVTNLLLEAAVESLNISQENIAQSRAARLVKSLERSLMEITGTRFQFGIEKFPQMTLSAIWGGTKLPFDVLPDGLRAIIGWLVHALVMMDVWLQGKSDPLNTEAVFLIDEIESHLHPAWQRKILPAFQRLFPKAQIFVATHSPFVIASLNHGWIHSLKLESDGTVKNEKPKAASKGDSYITVVEDIMGVREWFDPETEKLLADFRNERELAYKGDASAKSKAVQLAQKIGDRSMELHYMMGRELSQMERQLTNVVAK